MIKNKKGITVVSTIITIVVLSILAGTITVSTNYILEDTYRKEFDREYKLVQAAANDYVMRNSGIVDFEETTLDISKIKYKYQYQFEKETAENDIINMYVIDLEKIGVEDATYGIKLNNDEDDVYLLSKETNIVYYKKGFEDGDNIYYIAVND